MTTLILGVSSWVSAYLTPALYRKGVRVIGTFHNTFPHGLNGMITPIQWDARDLISLETLIADARPDVIVNLLHTDDTKIIEDVNNYIVKKIRNTSVLYVFLSSALAFDADLSSLHREDDVPRAVSPYGVSTVGCERAIRDAHINHLIVRIAAIHGYAPNKISRTERFLQSLFNDEVVEVDAGVIQNRLSVQRMADTLAALIALRATGTLHLGTEDASTESSFLRQLALAFGYNSEQVVDNPSPVRNLVVLPGEAYNILGPKFRSTETDTIMLVRQIPQFAKYIKT
ncbi:MAG: sugar nucleotide-binding protein [Patescibacteria group bacterium]